MIKFDKKYLFLIALYFCMQISIACYGPYLNVFFKEQGISTSVIGLIAAIAPLSAIVIQPNWANLSDKTGKKHTIITFLYIACAVSMLLYYLVDSLWGYVAINAIYSMFFTGIPALQDSYVLGLIEKDGHSYSTIRMAGTLGYAFGVIAFSKVFAVHLNWLFAFASIFFVITVCLFTKGVPKVDTPVAKDKQASSNEGIFKNKNVIIILIILMAVYTSISFVGSFVGIFVVEMGYATTYVSLCTFVSTFSEVPVLFMANKLIAKHGEMKLLILSGILTTIRMLLSSTGILWVIILMQAMQGVTYMLNFYCGTTLMFRIMPEHLKSKGQSMIFLVQSGVGSIIGNVVGGLVADKLGFATTFRVIGFTTFAFTIFVMFMYIKNNKNDSDSNNISAV